VKFRNSLLIGTIKSGINMYQVLDELRNIFRGNTYNLIQRNCNDFSQELVFRLTGKNIPSYINRLAYLGRTFWCCIPWSLKDPT
jgi:deubiquitinase DESI2